MKHAGTGDYSRAARDLAARSGARNASGQAALAAFPDEPILLEDYERAAEFFNACRAKGVQASHIDFLICAVAARAGIPIWSADQGFRRLGAVLSVVVY